MARTTIDYGVDLGTTNSSIAVLSGASTEIFKNNLDQDITPSVVGVDNHGQLVVGTRARSLLENCETADSVQREFKRLMGTEHAFVLGRSGRTMTAEQLSAEVLKSLRSDVERRTGETIASVVIAVPAAFDQRQCQATQRAAELAGFASCPLLQEPVASALAYGYQSEASREYWLVYDFGGGTFDASLIKADDGVISVVNHGGDNHLGGGDIDRQIVDRLIVPELVATYSLPEFTRGNGLWRAAYARLDRAAEEAKIQLTTLPTAWIENCAFEDNSGKHVDVQYELTSGAVQRIALPFLERSAEVCRRVLHEKGIEPSALERMILVGGPTKAPYVRELLRERLGVNIDVSIDPMTAVARGAAVFAGSQTLKGTARPRATEGQYEIEAFYTPIAANEQVLVVGKVMPLKAGPIAGFTLEFANTSARVAWRSGRILLSGDGRFKTELVGEKGIRNVFEIELRDATGNRLATQPGELPYTVGMVVSEQVLPVSIGVALANNTVLPVFDKGQPLPATTTAKVHAAHTLVCGSDGSLHIPLVEGENPHADCNKQLSFLTIHGTDVRHDLQTGTEIELTVNMDSSRNLTFAGFIPLLDQDIASEDYETDRRSASKAALDEQLEVLHEQLEKVAGEADEIEGVDIEDELDELQSTKVVEVDDLVENATDDDAANQAQDRLLEVRAQLHALRDKLRWPKLVVEANEAVSSLRDVARDFGSQEQQTRARDLNDDIKDALERKDVERLQRRVERVDELKYQILMERPEFWVGWLEHLQEHVGEMSNRTMAGQLLARGRQCTVDKDFEGLRAVVQQLLGLLPTETAEALRQGYGSGVVR